MEDFTPLNLSADEKAPEENISAAAIHKAADEEDPNAEVNKEAKAEESGSEPPGEKEQTVADTIADGVVKDNSKESGETASAETGADKLDKVIEMQKKLLESIDSLDHLFNARIIHTDYEEKIVDQMHKELQKYKDDLYAQLVRPILLDVIEVRDSIMRMSAAYLSKPADEQSIPNKIFSDYSYDLQDILEKNLVEIYRSKSGDDFIPVRQRIVKKVATDDESLHGKVADSLSCGYSYNGRTISAEKITIFYYEKFVQENENSEVIENG